ncbi:hypothetical protein BcDW1_8064 [Botrytis cinerea BcDW1]|uniref:Uncharacterized protein n=1 Tax=Botryotinia fuckeliana (strain BcDW1) TaxID=1290391 RepID=M7TQ67_BOTF1|nr:hypothetical protein BcDW1_8064 [Botrytis cinerea BcDW1]
MIFGKENFKGSLNSRNPTKLPRSVAASAHPHIKMNPSTPTFISPVKSESDQATCRTPETPTQARSSGKSNRKGKNMSRKTSFSKIPSSPGSTRSHLSNLLPTSPIAFSLAGRTCLRYRDTPSVSSSDSDSTIRETIAEAMATDQFAMPKMGLPLSPQNNAGSIVSSMSSFLANKGKSLPTTGTSLPEPTVIRGVIPQMESPQPFSEPMASPAVSYTVLAPNTSYISSTNTSIKISAAPSKPSASRKPAGSFLSRLIHKQTESTPLLKRQRSSTDSSRHVVSSSAPSEFYEYHTINGTVDLPFASKKCSSGDSSGYNSGISSSSSAPSSRTSLRNIYGGFLRNMKPRLLSAYILFGGSIIWLIWMTSNKILIGRKGNPGHSRGGIGGHVPPYELSIPVLTPSFATPAVEELVPVDEPNIFTGDDNNRQITHTSHKSRPNPPPESEPEEGLWDILSLISVPLRWVFGICLGLLFIFVLINYLTLIFPLGVRVGDGGWREKL